MASYNELYILSQIVTTVDEMKQLLTEAAQQGSGYALGYIGMRYRDGIEGFEKNPELGVEYIKQAAEKGIACYQNSYAYCLDTGIGIQQDFKEALVWYLKAANNGDYYAQYNLSCYYTNEVYRQRSNKMA